MINSNKSIIWINNLKALSVLAVFFVHCQLYYGCVFDTANRYICPWYVNSFFFISGYLLYWKQLSEPRILESIWRYLNGGGKKMMLNILYRIVIPSIIFSLIEYIPSCLIQGRPMDIPNMLYKTIGGQTYWFTSALVVAEFLVILMLLTRRKNIWLYFATSMVIGSLGIWMAYNEIVIFQKNLWACQQGLIAVIFLSFGGLYWRYEKLLNRLLKWSSCLILLVCLIIIIERDNPDPLISTLSIQPLGVVTSLIACILLVQFCKASPEVKFLTYIGQNSIGFYFMSGALPIVFSLIMHKLFSGYYILILAVVFLLSIFTAYIVMKVLIRWIPWLFDMRLIKQRKYV